MVQPDLRCYHHPDRQATGQCDRCGDLLCPACVRNRLDDQLCPQCLDHVAPSYDPSVFSEPHLRGSGFRPDRGAPNVDEPTVSQRRNYEDDIEHSVWEEPGLSSELAGAVPSDQLTWFAWLERRRDGTSPALTWLVALGVAIVAGPFAIIGALWGSGQTMFSVLAIVVIAPVVEEVLKVALPAYITETKPFLFRNTGQILFTALMGGLAFACIENVLYLYVYVPDPSPGLALWRWTICLALHTGCSLIAGLGVARVWREVWRRRSRPMMSLAYPYTLAAICIHGSYNLFALLLEATKFRF